MIVLCVPILCVYCSEMLCAHLYLPPICVGMRDKCMNYLDVEFTAIKILFLEMLIMLGIKFITKTEFFTRVEFITRPIPNSSHNPFSRFFDMYSEL